jgi:hypothetical protein
MRVLSAIFLVALVSCSSPSEEKPSVQPEPQGAGPLSGEAARSALAEYIRTHPDVFASPGRVEVADNVLSASIAPRDEDRVLVDMFIVDLDKRTYHLSHRYGEPGSGWFENWMWDGSFETDANGRWIATKPEFKKAWGE